MFFVCVCPCGSVANSLLVHVIGYVQSKPQQGEHKSHAFAPVGKGEIEGERRN